MKLCTGCGEEKPLADFYSYKRKNRASVSYTSTCKPCFNAKAKAKRDGDPELRARQAEAHKRKLKDPEFRAKAIAKSREWYASNKERQKEYGKQYRARPDRIEKDRTRKSAWNKSPAGRAYFAERIRDYRRSDEGRLVDVLRRLLYRTIDATGERKITSSAVALGYTKEKLSQRIECQFKPGMSWDNHGEWHIDHKKPITAFVRQGVTDPRIINALSNLQPLWAKDNLAKSDKWEPIAAANDNGEDSIAA